MTDTRRWLEYFRANQQEPGEIPWEEAVVPPDPVRRFLVPSLQQFQLGEAGAGRHFLELARQHAAATGDPDFPEAIALFIAEEQRHSRLLARYLCRIGAPLLSRHWLQGVFRHLRHWAGLEAKVRVLVTAEVMAIPYYRAVMAAAGCPVLTAICRRILKEEAQHLTFQGNTLRRIQRHRPAWLNQFSGIAQHLLLSGTCLITWLEHRKVFRAAGQTPADVRRAALAAMRHVQRSADPW